MSPPFDYPNLDLEIQECASRILALGGLFYAVRALQRANHP
jgi:hypothetical protein